ncbi:DegT/DnrJ/EryC1/StrS family aminotransferase [Magnetovibrio blakemorei]|uniref:DegT/DnrJ/EryC1/StrS family aminotransferase n=1 Tax=Magnetovibrio blakemorei TaxID=28181 RepID=UPI003898E759
MFVARRRELVECYDTLLKPLFPNVRPLARNQNGESSWHLYVVHIDFQTLGIERSEVMRLLAEHGIGSQVHYLPVHRQPYYEKRYGNLDFTGANQYYDTCLSLPLYPTMLNDDVAHVVNSLTSIILN